MHVALVIGLSLLTTSTAALSGAAASTVPDVGHQQMARHDKTCKAWENGQACYVSWYRLLAHPEAYRDKVVWITGYLVSDFGELILYPNKADYEATSEVDSVLLVRPFAIPKDVADKLASDAYPVTVMGRFNPDAPVAGFDIPRAGSLYDIHKIVSSPRVVSDEPLNMTGIRILPPQD